MGRTHIQSTAEGQLKKGTRFHLVQSFTMRLGKIIVSVEGTQTIFPNVSSRDKTVPESWVKLSLLKEAEYLSIMGASAPR